MHLSLQMQCLAETSVLLNLPYIWQMASHISGEASLASLYCRFFCSRHLHKNLLLRVGERYGALRYSQKVVSAGTHVYHTFSAPPSHCSLCFPKGPLALRCTTLRGAYKTLLVWGQYSFCESVLFGI